MLKLKAIANWYIVLNEMSIEKYLKFKFQLSAQVPLAQKLP